MVTLALETSGDCCSVAVLDGAAVLSEVVFEHERHLLERLPGVLSQALGKAGVGWGAIDRIAAGVGPGSFTGVRTAVVFAKASAWALGVPVAAVPTLEAASIDMGPDIPVVGLAPCRSGEAILWLGNRDYRVVAVDRIVSLVCDLHGDHDVVVVGDVGSLPEKPAGWLTMPGATTASQVGRWAAMRGNDCFGPPEGLVPMYVAPPPIRSGANK